ncbi:transcriptional regulator [Opitutaceae bacterium TAV5]|nr:transcriptional regulator [Opitutaceae bacterium TAV5]
MIPATDPFQQALGQHLPARSGAGKLRCRSLLALLVSAQKIRSFLRHCLLRQQLTECGFRLLAVLAAHGDRQPLNPTRIASLASMWPPTVTEALSRLEMSGLVSRERDPLDRRQISIRLTPDRGERGQAVVC